MKEETHAQIDLLVFGKSYPEVHRWIDATFPKWKGSGYPHIHWIERHNLYDIKIKYGDTLESEVAALHVMCDWLSHWGRRRLPRNRKEVVNFLMAVGQYNEKLYLTKNYEGVK